MEACCLPHRRVSFSVNLQNNYSFSRTSSIGTVECTKTQTDCNWWHAWIHPLTKWHLIVFLSFDNLLSLSLSLSPSLSLSLSLDNIFSIKLKRLWLFVDKCSWIIDRASIIIIESGAPVHPIASSQQQLNYLSPAMQHCSETWQR